ncbi:hypothetical protein BOX15_Mlig029785g2 [Macrostomum lignano]|uniref:Uncharacterized protein n=1 Tax=Macrostomum lignano TaxID=282301 RepID=A0A267H8Z4_9PLAT|nr:hypothetical protein BOX15_Mlig029785g2 [Macrostomum lignano]
MQPSMSPMTHQQYHCASPMDDDAYDDEDSSYQPPMRPMDSGDQYSMEPQKIYKSKKSASVVTSSCRRQHLQQKQQQPQQWQQQFHQRQTALSRMHQQQPSDMQAQQTQRTCSKVPVEYVSANDPIGPSSNEESDCSSLENPPLEVRVPKRHPNVSEDAIRSCGNSRLHQQQQISMYDQSPQPRATGGKQSRSRQQQLQMEMQIQQQKPQRPNKASMGCAHKQSQRSCKVPVPDTCMQQPQTTTGRNRADPTALSAQFDEPQSTLYGRSPTVTANGKPQSRRQQQQRLPQVPSMMQQEAAEFCRQQQLPQQHQRVGKMTTEYQPTVFSSSTKLNSSIPMLSSGDQGPDASFSEPQPQHQQHHTNSSNDFQQVVVSRLNLMLELVGCGQCESCQCSKASQQSSCLAPAGSMHHQVTTEPHQAQQVIRASLPGCLGGGRPLMPTSVAPGRRSGRHVREQL